MVCFFQDSAFFELLNNCFRQINTYYEKEHTVGKEIAPNILILLKQQQTQIPVQEVFFFTKFYFTKSNISEKKTMGNNGFSRNSPLTFLVMDHHHSIASYEPC